MADATFTIGSAAACSDGPCGDGEQGRREPGGPRGHPPGDRARAPQRPGPSGPARPGGGGCRGGPPPLHPGGVRAAAARRGDRLPARRQWLRGLRRSTRPTTGPTSGSRVVRTPWSPTPVGSSPATPCRRARSACGAASRVHASDGEIGKVEGLVVDPAHGHVTHVLLQEGHLWGRKQVAIPIGAVERLGEGIAVNLTKTRDRGSPRRRPGRPEPRSRSAHSSGRSGAVEPLRCRRPSCAAAAAAPSSCAGGPTCGAGCRRGRRSPCRRAGPCST